MYETIELQVDHRGVAQLALNRPEKHNAMSALMISELTTCVQALSKGTGVRVVVLRARGRSFCAGADLAWMQQQVLADGETRAREARNLAMMLKALNELPKPLIGVVQGNAFGGGIGLMSVCDSVFVSSHARFALTETRLGLVPATIGPYVIARIGASHARRLFTSAQMINAETAHKVGLATEVVHEVDLSTRIEQEVDQYLTCAPGAIAAAKKMVLSHTGAVTITMIDESIAALVARWETEEAAEGLAAFFEKRSPSWAESAD